MKRFIESIRRQDWECTLWPDLWFWKKAGCCIQHDHDCADAWFREDEEARREADRKFRKCVRENGPPLIGFVFGWVMYSGVTANRLQKKLRGLPEY